MATIPYEIPLYIDHPQQAIKFRLQQNDVNSLQIIITIYEDNEEFIIPTGYPVYLRMLKPDNKVVYNECSVENNKAIFSVTAQMTAMHGRASAQLEIIDPVSGGNVKTIQFHALIDEEVISDSQIESSNEFTALQSMAIYIADFSTRVAQIGDLTKLETTSNTDLVGSINEINTNVGNKTSLLTTIKTNIVNAINELVAKLANKIGKGDLFINVKDYGALGDGVNDDTTSIQDAINYAQSSGGGLIFFPRGTYLYTHLGVSENDITFRGVGNSTILKQTVASGIGFTCNNSSKRIENTEFTNMVFDSAIIRTANACIAFSDVIRPKVSSCKFYNQYDAINIEIFGGVRISDVIMENITRRGIYLYFGDDIMIDNCIMTNSKLGAIITDSCGVYWRSGGGVYITNTDVIGFDYGINISPEAGENASWGFFTNFLMDTGGAGMLANGFSGSVRGIHTTNCWSSSNQREGIRLINVKGYFSSNDRYLLNGTNGIFVNANVKDLSISNSHFIANNVGGSDIGSGIHFETGSNNFKLVGNSFVNDYEGFTVFNQKYGVYIEDGDSNNFLINDNSFRGNLVGTIYQPVLGNNIEIRNNIGDQSKTISSASSITIPPIGDAFIITGTTNILNANLSPLGRKITLIFTDILNINGGFNFKLVGGNMLTANNSTLTLISDGIHWQEICRTKNS